MKAMKLAAKLGMKTMKATTAPSSKAMKRAAKVAMRTMKMGRPPRKTDLQKMKATKLTAPPKRMKPMKLAMKTKKKKLKADGDSKWYYVDTKKVREVLVEHARPGKEKIKVWKLD